MNMMNRKRTSQHVLNLFRSIVSAAFLLCFGFLASSNAQVFWTETFDTGCNQGVLANNYTNVNGIWTVANSGTNDFYANQWYISGTEAGFAPGSCGNGCLLAPSLNNQTLHVGSVIGAPSVSCLTGDCGATYAKGVGSAQVTTAKLVYSPYISCVGKSNIQLEFNYIENGDTNVDNATVQYFDGAAWTTIYDTYKTSLACGSAGRWTHLSLALPLSANNNPNVRIGFEWRNNDDGIGSFPAFAVDDITLRTLVVNVIGAFSVDSNNTCAGLPRHFTDHSSGNPTGWIWLFPNGTPTSVVGTPTPTVTYNVTGTFNVTLIVSNATSTDTVTGSVNILNCSPPLPDFDGTPRVICRNHCVNFRDLSQNNPTSWTWRFNGSNTPTSNSPNPSNICYANSGVYDVTLIATNSFGTDSLTRTQYIRVDSCPPPVADFSPSSIITGCASDTVCINFTDESSNTPTEWEWSFPGGNPSSSTSASPQNICYTTEGLYDVMLTATNAGGSDSIIRYSLVHITGVPGALIDGSAPFDTIDFGGTDTLFVSGGISYQWLPANGLNPDSSTNPIIVVAPFNTTTYTCLITDNFCTSIRQITVRVRHTKHVFFIPNAFSPNQDGTNDKFYIRGNDIFSTRMVIFDRWGEKVFDSSDKSIGWDGTYKGEKVAMGVYTYVAYIIFSDGFSESKAGSVALIR